MIAGGVKLEASTSIISSSITSIGSKIGSFLISLKSSSSLSSDSSSNSNSINIAIISGVLSAGSWIWTGMQLIWKWLIGFVYFIVSQTWETIRSLCNGVWTTLTAFIVGGQVWELVKKIPKGLLNLFIFFLNPTKRADFTDLFGSDYSSGALESLKVLSGYSKGSKNDVFKVDSGLLPTLIKKLMESPERVMARFKQLSKLIEKIQEKKSAFSHGSSNGSSNGSSQYTLTTQNLETYLEVDKGLASGLHDIAFLNKVVLELSGVKTPELPGSNFWNGIGFGREWPKT